MGSVMVLGRISSTDDVVSAAEKFILPNVHRFDAEIGPGQAEAVKTVVTGSITRLQTDRDTMVAADELTSLERTQDVQSTGLITKAAENAREVIVPARRTLNGMYGSAYVLALGFDGPTPDDPVALVQLVRSMQQRVRTVPVPPSVFGGAAVDPIGLVDAAVPAADALEAALRHGTEERRETQVALEQKRAAIARFDRSFSLAANTVSNYLDFLGERELARKVRPSSRRPGNTVQEAGGEADPEQPIPAGDAPASDVPAAE